MPGVLSNLLNGSPRFGCESKDGRLKTSDHTQCKPLSVALAVIAHPNATFRSDENPFHPHFVKKHFPSALHERATGGRAAIAGQGELKKKKFDPLFSLNHTCATLRANHKPAGFWGSPKISSTLVLII